MALKRGIVNLYNYSEDWTFQYVKEERLLKKVLGSKIKEIHHVGSTSIFGLKAKPIIDILLLINSFDDIEDISNILKDYDYENRGTQGVSDRYFFAKGPDDARSHYLHVVEEKSDTYYNQLYFKKYLLDHPDYVRRYSLLKVDLASKYANDRKLYTQGKEKFIKEVILLAKEEYGVYK